MLLSKILYPTHLKRLLFFLFFDTLIICLSLYFSFLLRFEFNLPPQYKSLLFKTLPLFVLFKLLSFAGFKIYKLTWRYVGINDLWSILKAVIVAELFLMVFILLTPFDVFVSHFSIISRIELKGFPRSIFVLDSIFTLLLISGLRISKRFYIEVFSIKQRLCKGKRTVIIGAGNTGEMVLRDIAKQNFCDFYPVCFLDDDIQKIGSYIHGVKVIARLDKLKNVIKKYGIEAVIIAIPSLSFKILREIYYTAKSSEIGTIKIVPRIYSFDKPNINIKDFEDISIEDLIGRQEVKVNYEEIEKFLKDKIILITGAGGSIGSEIAFQVCAFHPLKVILFDIDETALHNMMLKIEKSYPQLKERVFYIVGDIKDENRVNIVFEQFSPEIVFHAAAYKHVPMMEFNPTEAIKTNIFGTYNIAKVSVLNKASKFILISTDKAVKPTSIMGATKRMAEFICKAFNNEKTEFVSVRFGNVLGSRGSVLPLFLEQIKQGGPLTVTHPEMKRYFMTIPEAVTLVLQASIIGKGGEVLVLDMGEPIHITRLAEELIRIHGLEPHKDIKIVFTGIRPGEKLFEEILTAEEGTFATKHERIYIAKNSAHFALQEMEKILDEFKTVLGNNDRLKIRQLLKKYVKHYED